MKTHIKKQLYTLLFCSIFFKNSFAFIEQSEKESNNNNQMQNNIYHCYQVEKGVYKNEPSEEELLRKIEDKKMEIINISNLLKKQSSNISTVNHDKITYLMNKKSININRLKTLTEKLKIENLALFILLKEQVVLNEEQNSNNPAINYDQIIDLMKKESVNENLLEKSIERLKTKNLNLKKINNINDINAINNIIQEILDEEKEIELLEERIKE
jgi:hypothetical protein